MKIKCPKCKEDAELAMDYSFVKCSSCDLDMSYGEYVNLLHIMKLNIQIFLEIMQEILRVNLQVPLDEWD